METTEMSCDLLLERLSIRSEGSPIGKRPIEGVVDCPEPKRPGFILPSFKRCSTPERELAEAVNFLKNTKRISMEAAHEFICKAQVEKGFEEQDVADWSMDVSIISANDQNNLELSSSPDQTKDDTIDAQDTESWFSDEQDYSSRLNTACYIDESGNLADISSVADDTC